MNSSCALNVRQIYEQKYMTIYVAWKDVKMGLDTRTKGLLGGVDFQLWL